MDLSLQVKLVQFVPGISNSVLEDARFCGSSKAIAQAAPAPGSARESLMTLLQRDVLRGAKFPKLRGSRWHS